MTFEQKHHLKFNVVRDLCLFAGTMLVLIEGFVSYAMAVILFVVYGYGYIQVVRNYHQLKQDTHREAHKNSWELVAWNTVIAIATVFVIMSAPLHVAVVGILAGLYMATIVLAAPLSFPEKELT